MTNINNIPTDQVMPSPSEMRNSDRNSLLLLMIGVSVCLLLIVGFLSWRLWEFSFRKMNKQLVDSQLVDYSLGLKLPTNAVQVSGCIAKAGEHWVQPDNLPTGPFYLVYNGNITAIEYMLSPAEVGGDLLMEQSNKSGTDSAMKIDEGQMDMKDESPMLGMNMDKARDLPDTLIKSWSIHWTPAHSGYSEPHYHVRFYLVDDQERSQVCPESTSEEIMPGDIYDILKSKGIQVPEN